MVYKTGTKGFTLVEVVIVVAIIGILAAIAVPAFLSWLPNMRLKAAARDVHGALVQIKGEAAKRNVASALTINQPIGGVNQAYVLYEDANVNAQYEVGETIIMQVQQWPDDVTFDITQGVGTWANPTIIFRPNTIPEAWPDTTVGTEPTTVPTPADPNSTIFLTILATGRTLGVSVSSAGSISTISQ